MRYLFLTTLTLLVACTTATPPAAPTPPEPVAPWNTHAPLARSAAPGVLLTEWERAENRTTCAPLALADTGARVANATPRRANFSGGWAVAWDAPGLPGRDPSGNACATCGRGAFGIAGTGSEATGGDSWNPGDGREYAGENRATYGPEGGSGPSWLANVTVDDQRCLYQVWSFLGRDHLEHLLANLRRVQ